MTTGMSPVAFALHQTPCVQWPEEITEREVALQADRALCFMDDLQRDMTILQAGLIAIDWDVRRLRETNKTQLKRDLSLFKNVFHKHQPSKFKQLAGLMALQEKQEQALQPKIQWCSTDLSNGFVSSTTSTSINSQINYWVQTNNRVRTINTYYENEVARTFVQWWEQERDEHANEYLQRQNEMAAHNNRILISNNATAEWRISTINHTATTRAYNTNARWYIAQSEELETKLAPRRDFCWRLKTAARKLQSQVPAESKRRVVKRQLDLLGSVLAKPGDVNVFLKGEALEIESKTSGLKYRFTRRSTSRSVNQLVEASHAATPYQLEVFSQDNVYLTSLCVYVKQTPALDQLAAMIMYIQSGEEAQLLETGNFYSVGDSERLSQELQRLGLLKKVQTYGWVQRNNDALAAPSTLPTFFDASQDTIAREYPEIVAARSLARDYHFLKLFNKDGVH